VRPTLDFRGRTHKIARCGGQKCAAAVLLVAAPSPASAAARTYTAVDLGTLGGTTSGAAAMNDAGQVVGHAQTAAGQTHAFRWQRGVMTDLGTLPGGGYSVAVDINAYGLVAGNAVDAAGDNHAVVWDRGRIVDLGTLGGAYGSVAAAVNDRGQVLGESSAPDGRQHRFLWQRGTLTDLGPGCRASRPTSTTLGWWSARR
jgi:probable HAF family extracellular repeat protein